MLSGYPRATTSGAQESSHEPRQDRLAVYLYDGPVVVDEDEDDIPDRSHRQLQTAVLKSFSSKRLVLIVGSGRDSCHRKRYRQARRCTGIRNRLVPQGVVASRNVGDVVQLVRTLPCHGRGRGFESRRPRHSFQEFA